MPKPQYRCPIRRVHADGSTCEHKHGPNGRHIDDDCPGAAGYEARCSCGEDLGRQTLRTVLEDYRRVHLQGHRLREIRTVELPTSGAR